MFNTLFPSKQTSYIVFFLLVRHRNHCSKSVGNELVNCRCFIHCTGTLCENKIIWFVDYLFYLPKKKFKNKQEKSTFSVVYLQLVVLIFTCKTNRTYCPCNVIITIHASQLKLTLKCCATCCYVDHCPHSWSAVSILFFYFW